ncbi:MAG TPA: PQQ-dependent sugar dehydrogenase [Casimicrobiaceae bacterium]|nr:PQQ-dependent sugar dehydrogenase [Casimicrobiaceae bacterium]
MPFASGVSAPVEIVNAGDSSGRLFVVEQGGRIRIIRNGALLATPFLDASSLVVSGGEQGLLGLAFHPQYRSNGRFFINYTRAADGATVIASYRVSASNPDAADPASAQVLLVIAQPFANHNGGTLRFGPDGYLYIGLGDGGSANDPDNHAQDPLSLLGKMLRIDVDHGSPYAIPPSNPYAGSTLNPSPRSEIFASGLRNPWKFSFDRATGDLYIGDVGQDAREEIDVLPRGGGAGADFGWRVMEGFLCTGLAGGPACNSPALTLPIFDYGHDQGCSITGGYVYRGSEAPSLVGRYVFADYCSGRFWALSRSAAGTYSAELILQRGNGPTSFGEDEQGNLYFADASAGAIMRIVDDAPPLVRVIEYYNAALDHYFMTSAAAEIDLLDRQVLPGWTRTGYAFNAYAWAVPGYSPVCRFYLPPGTGDSHFYSVSPAECAEVAQRYPAFVLETWETFALAPGPVDGICPIGLVPVYRLWNGRVDTNHRYTTDGAVRDMMVARGFVAEGYGPVPVAMCAPS